MLLLQVKVGADCTDGSSKRSSTELRALWKKAMLETLLLIRMEKENSDIKGMTLTDLFLSSFNFTFLSFFFFFFSGGGGGGDYSRIIYRYFWYDLPQAHPKQFSIFDNTSAGLRSILCQGCDLGELCLLCVCVCVCMLDESDNR